MTGVDVRTRTARFTGLSVTPTDQLFIAGPAPSVDEGVQPILSTDDLEAVWGDRTGALIPSWDAVDVFKHEGGKKIIFAPYLTGSGHSYQDALALLDDKRLGPGQLIVIGAAPAEAVYSDLHAACIDMNRVALRDVADDATIAEMQAQGDMAVENDPLGAAFGPWVIVPPPAGVIGATERQVPASVAVAGLCARVDEDGNPNRAAAGEDYSFQYVTGLVSDITDAQRETLFGHGVNSLQDVDNILQVYGFQTNIPGPDPTNPYWQFNVSRGEMWLKERARVRAKPYVFRPIDGRGNTAGKLKSNIETECKFLWDHDGLFGDTPQDAYAVHVTETLSEIAQGALHVTAEVVWTPHAKDVLVDLVTVPIGAPL